MTKHKKSHKQKHDSAVHVDENSKPDTYNHPAPNPHMTFNMFNQNINRPPTPEPTVSCWDGINKTFGCCKS